MPAHNNLDRIAPRLLRAKPAAAYLGVSLRMLRQLVEDGLPYLQPGKGDNSPWYFDRADLDAWIERNKTIL